MKAFILIPHNGRRYLAVVACGQCGWITSDYDQMYCGNGHLLAEVAMTHDEVMHWTKGWN